MDPQHLIRVDKQIQKLYPQLNSRHIEEALAEHLITGADGNHLKKGRRIPIDTQLDTSALDNHLSLLNKGSTIEIHVVAEEEDWLVLDKPAGIHSHPLSLFDRDTVTHWAFTHYPAIQAFFPNAQPTISPHRLDRDTSGLLIVAKNEAGFLYWRNMFSAKEVTKKYLAWCWGTANEDNFTIEAPLIHSTTDRRKMAVSEGGVTAVTKVTVIEHREDRVLCDIEMLTGITHQIRVHLHSRLLPLIGDCLYDEDFSSRKIKPPHHALRSYSLTTSHHRYELLREFPFPL